MPDNNHRHQQIQRTIPVFPKTASATLTDDELKGAYIKCSIASGVLTITIPAAASKHKGRHAEICNNGAGQVNVNVAAGFGGGGTDRDARILNRGEFVTILCDGTSWYLSQLPG